MTGVFDPELWAIVHRCDCQPDCPFVYCRPKVEVPDGKTLTAGLPARPWPFNTNHAPKWAATVAGAAGDLAALTDGRKLTLAKKVYRLGIEAGDKSELKGAARALLEACVTNGLVDDVGRRYCVDVIKRGLRKGWCVGAQQDAALSSRSAQA